MLIQTLKFPLLALLLSTSGLLLTPSAFAQEADSVYMIVDEMPQLLPDDSTGFAAMMQEMTYPESAKEAGAEGRVFVQFVVDEEGNVTEPVVQMGIHEALNAEALRVVQTVKFKPGLEDGEPVKVKLALPFTFRLPADSTSTPADTTGAQPGQ